MQLEVVDILERVGVTCVMVTHDQEEAMTMAGRIAIMNRGKFVQIGEPEDLRAPTTRYSAEFIGSVNVFEGLVKERLEDGLVLSSPGLMHPLKVDPDASVVTTCRSGWRCVRRRSCCAMNRRRTATICRRRGDSYRLSGDLYLSCAPAKRADDQRPAAE